VLDAKRELRAYLERGFLTFGFTLVPRGHAQSLSARYRPNLDRAPTCCVAP